MLPLSERASRSRNTRQVTYWFIRGTLSVSEMDIDYAFTQLMYLCFAPKRVYQLTTYRKQIKNYWCRDDPAILLLQIAALTILALSISIGFANNSREFWLPLINIVLVQFIGCGVFLASVYHYVCEKFMRTQRESFGSTQLVEWSYCFDVHINGFFPLFLLIHVLGFYSLPLLNSESTICSLCGNSIVAIGTSYYFYIVSIGFHTLPFLNRSELFLYPAGVCILVSLVLSIFRFNMLLVIFRWSLGFV